jgi:hypothetical protein
MRHLSYKKITHSSKKIQPQFSRESRYFLYERYLILSSFVTLILTFVIRPWDLNHERVDLWSFWGFLHRTSSLEINSHHKYQQKFTKYLGLSLIFILQTWSTITWVILDEKSCLQKRLNFKHNESPATIQESFKTISNYPEIKLHDKKRKENTIVFPSNFHQEFSDFTSLCKRRQNKKKNMLFIQPSYIYSVSSYFPSFCHFYDSYIFVFAFFYYFT